MTGIHFTTRKPRNAREVEELRWSRLVEKAFHMYSRVKGILYVSETRAHYLPSLVHGKEEVEYVLNVFTSFLDELKKSHYLMNPRNQCESRSKTFYSTFHHDEF